MKKIKEKIVFHTSGLSKGGGGGGGRLPPAAEAARLSET